MWGDLWTIPFHVEIWGPVAAWVSALLTGLAFFIAALVYRRDSNLGRSLQAKQIRARILDDTTGEKTCILIENYPHGFAGQVRPLADVTGIRAGASRTDP